MLCEFPSAAFAAKSLAKNGYLKSEEYNKLCSFQISLDYGDDTEPYISQRIHAMRVAGLTAYLLEDPYFETAYKVHCVVIAVFHDILKDRPWYKPELEKHLPEEIFQVLLELANPRKIPYTQWSTAIATKGSLWGKIVVLADAFDHLSPERSTSKSIKNVLERYIPTARLLLELVNFSSETKKKLSSFIDTRENEIKVQLSYI